MDTDWLWAGDDPLGEALHLLRMSGTMYFHSQLGTPWGMTIPPIADCLWLHVVTSGRALLSVGDDEHELRPGALTLVPHGAGHALRSEAGAAVPSVIGLPHDVVTDRYAIIRAGGPGPVTTMICAAVKFEHPAARTLAALLPPALHVEPSGSAQSEWLQSTLRLVTAEAAQQRPGGETVLTRLTDVLVVQAIRAWLDEDPAARSGWLGALRDPQIGRALTLVHRFPARDWTLATLAGEVAMSRSAFAARFTELVGEPAMQYLTRWRLHAALDWLDEGATVAELAGRLGYRSEAAFSRAFKRVVGVAPATARRRRARKPDVDHGSPNGLQPEQALEPSA
jgi:AraC-like DNA-binding protein